MRTKMIPGNRVLLTDPSQYLGRHAIAFHFRLDGKQNTKRQNGMSANILNELAGGVVYVQGGVLQKVWPDGTHQILTVDMFREQR